MRIASFLRDGRPGYGIVRDGGIAAVRADWCDRYPDIVAVLAAGRLSELEDACDTATVSPSALRFLPAVPHPGKILCVGVNYRPHAEEMGRKLPDYPVLFVRFPDSIVGHGEQLVRPAVSEQFDFEGELAVVIGRTARHVPASRALEHVAGFTCFMDGSVRDWQRHTMQFTPGKNFRHSGAMGPWIATRDAVGDAADLPLTTRVNGAGMQQGRTSELIFGVPALIEYCSTFAELLPGDVIATGTPGGVGAGRTPPVWLRDGDVVSVDIGGIGRLENPVRDE
jgi:2-keto-4-pentenoate hydratase/2-oxohepta-3-ene-1,7-dioic acid hydratase in catechol pathway